MRFALVSVLALILSAPAFGATPNCANGKCYAPTVTTRATSSTTIRTTQSVQTSATRGRLVRTPVMDRVFGPPRRPVLRGLIKIGVGVAIFAAI